MKDDAVIKDNEAVYLLNEQTYSKYQNYSVKPKR